MKWMTYIMVFVLISLGVAAAPAVEITPFHPYPNEKLTCTYLDFQQGDTLKFEPYPNNILDEERVREGIDKPSVLFDPQLQSGDFFFCVVYKKDAGGEYRLVDENKVDVGKFQCNDGLDNDNDGKTDSNDEGCESRVDNEELHLGDDIFLFCMNNPGNFFCSGLGYYEWKSLCDANPDNHLCSINLGLSGALEGYCRDEPGAEICTGKEDIGEYCIGKNIISCTQMMQGVVSQCEDRNICMELTREDENLLCEIDGSHDFCPAFLDTNTGGLNEPCFEGSCDGNLVCSENEICIEPEETICDEGDDRLFECPKNIDITQECIDNEWVGECPDTECSTGDTRKIICPEGKEITQECIVYEWYGECPELQPGADPGRIRVKKEPLAPSAPVSVPEKQKSTWPYIAVTLILAVLILAVVYLLNRTKK